MKRKSRETCVDRYGVPNAFMSPIVQQHAIETVQRKYGVNHSCEIPHVKTAAHTPIALQRAHDTKKTNGTYKRSRPEIELGERLLALTLVTTQVWLKPNFSIDFQLPEHGCYIQFDGVHWHGIDGQSLGETRHDQIIVRKRQIDADLDRHVNVTSKRLIRVTDVWYKTHHAEAPNVLLRAAADTSWTGVRYFGERHGQ